MRTGSNLTALSIFVAAILMTVRDSISWMAAAGVLLVCRIFEVTVVRKEGREDVMQFRKVSLLGLGALMLIAGMALAKVTTDYDHDANFSKYRSFSWVMEPHTKNPLMKDRIVEAINQELRAKGLTLVENGGSLDIAAHAATKEEKTLQSFYDGFPGWGWNSRFGGTTTVTVDTYEVGTLVVDLFDSSTKQVVWRGVATDTISDDPDKNTKKLHEDVADMFKKFPPKGKED
jgi:hypothetical protein